MALSLGETFRDMRERGLENVFQRFYSFYQAKFTDAADPQQLGRGAVTADSIGYSEKFLLADTFSPFASDDAGFFFPPYEDDNVYVTFDHGDISSPMVMGSFWKTRGQRRSADSGLPAEFVKTTTNATGDEVGVVPSRRGIKVKVGSGLLFDETADQVKVEVWTGVSQGIGKPSTRNHEVILNDTKDDENVLVKSKGGHQTTWRDKVGEVYVETMTSGKHQFLMDDTGKKILVKSTGAHSITIDDSANTIEAITASKSKILIDGNKNDITLETAALNKVVISDSEGKISATTPLKRELTISDSLQTIKAFSPLPPQTIQMSPVSGTTITDTSALGATILASSGPLTATGQGTVMTSAGGLPAVSTQTGISSSTTTGLKTDVLLGGEIKTITGGWVVNGAFLGAINALALFLGTGVQLRLVNENFFTTAYGVHFHLTTAPGAPTSPPVFGLGIVGTHTTTQVTAS